MHKEGERTIQFVKNIEGGDLPFTATIPFSGCPFRMLFPRLPGYLPVPVLEGDRNRVSK